MNCWNCDARLIWGGDNYIEDEEYSVETNLSCPDCDCLVLVLHPRQTLEEEE